MGTSKLETVKALMNAGARLDYRTFSGGAVLSSERGLRYSDPNVMRLILEKLKSSSDSKTFISMGNYQRKSTTLKWKSIYFIAKVLVPYGFIKVRAHGISCD
jgi:hypothetical protein